MIDFKKENVDLFIIHTNSYSGNFERDMAEYITGIPYDYFENPSPYLSDDDFSFENIIKPFIDKEYHVSSYVSMYSNPDYLNNGLGYIFHVDDKIAEEEARSFIKEYYIEEAKENINKYQAAVDDFHANGETGKLYSQYAAVKWTLDSLKNYVEKSKKDLKEYTNKSLCDFHMHIAYCSIAISFEPDYLTDEIIELIKERAQGFHYETSDNKEGFKITGFEILSSKTEQSRIV